MTTCFFNGEMKMIPELPLKSVDTCFIMVNVYGVKYKCLIVGICLLIDKPLFLPYKM